ncbi:hypothetical protein D9613_000817 [Agrocybe pediades]|uniref:Asteroid domain-containing protein n=1 Tax=Agrocybe pediades TaxID=84607 RepID=A0A8H4VSN7_9AGAR|nr:hypothetical protein D9613_000817 [Agrocybe pediades]
MGVHGLTTYLREKQRILSTTTVASSSSTKPIPIVVDGWSFIYDLYQHSNLPWVYGGEYAEFVELVKFAVKSWVKVGLQVNFVFDGARPNIKFATTVSRLNQSLILPAQLFFRTSKASRSTGRFLNENRIIPPLLYSTCVQTLQSLKAEYTDLDIHFADEEGDPFSVELAGRLGAFVVGNDSDFVILNSDGYMGYIPLDEMVWKTPQRNVVQEDDNDGDFQTVRKPKAKKAVSYHTQGSVGLIPPVEDGEELSLSFISYSPETLAKHLNIPVSLLPLFGALVGNDFSRDSESQYRRMQTLFFERTLTPSQRIEKVASTLRSVISPGVQHRKTHHPVGSVMDLIDRTVRVLLARAISTLGSGEVETIIETVVSSTLQYALPKTETIKGREGLWPTTVCALHEPEACSILPMVSHNVMQQAEKSDMADPNLLDAREKFLDAYRGGLLDAKVMDVLNTGTSWPRLFLENPDSETVARSIGQPIRKWIYVILHDTVGLSVSETDETNATQNSQSVGEESDQDELIDVVESDSDDDNPSNTDYLAPLKGELHRLQSDGKSESDEEHDSSASEPPASIISHRHLYAHPPTVVEYIRKGSRIAAETLTLEPFSDLLSSVNLPNWADDNEVPLVLRPEDDRFTLLLRILKSDVPAVRALPAEAVARVLAVRWVISVLHSRWEDTNSKEREKERWTKNEAHCLLSAFSPASKTHGTEDLSLDGTLPSVEDRNVQLTAQILMALETIEQLSESLLLLERVPSNACYFSGKLFHAALTSNVREKTPLDPGVWEAVESGLFNAFQEDRTKKSKPKSARSSAKSVPSLATRPGNKRQGLFAMLGDLDA